MNRRMRSSLLHNFLHSEATGGVLLMLAAAAALLIANSPWAAVYFHSLRLHIGPLSVLHWINDGLMALFFLLVGLEVKREFVSGQLSRWSDRALPMIAAAGGMAVPALVYLAVSDGVPGLARGWAIPAATDIAFAIGVLALLGRRVPTSLKLFLVTVAVVDDMGAVAIIALFYATDINILSLVMALFVMLGMFALNRFGVGRLLPYLGLAVLLWLAIFLSGAHATIAGVLTALFIPLRLAPNAPSGAAPPLARLEQGLHPLTAWAIVPLFGFANAGVSFAGLGPEQLFTPLSLAVGAGLFLGKQTGLLGMLWLCVRLRLAQKPTGASWVQIYGVCVLCGIGFTMSLFIGGLAFADPLLLGEVKIGVLGGSLLSAILGWFILRMSANSSTLPDTRSEL